MPFRLLRMAYDRRDAGAMTPLATIVSPAATGTWRLRRYDLLRAVVYSGQAFSGAHHLIHFAAGS